MKYRKDFVTNSSSSSYTCEICGSEESGWDYCLSDVGMVTCENGHTFCEDHLKNLSAKDILDAILTYDKEQMKWHRKLGYEYTPEYTPELEKESSDSLWDTYIHLDDVRCSISSRFCPICNFENITDDDIASYFLKKAGITRTKLAEKWKQEFGTYKKLREFVR